MLELVPRLKPIKVDPGKLLLDPNNPRFVTSHDDHVAYDRIADPAEIDRTARRMFPGGKDDEFRIEELVNSILRNGWQSIDSIFVRRYMDTDYYVVLEGNRRVTAIREILRRPDTPKESAARTTRMACPAIRMAWATPSQTTSSAALPADRWSSNGIPRPIRLPRSCTR